MANIIYKDVAPGAKEYVAPVITDQQPFCDANDLKSDIIVPQVATPRTKLLEARWHIQHHARRPRGRLGNMVAKHDKRRRQLLISTYAHTNLFRSLF